ncbi:MAG: ArsR family transcriptional regulator [Candidatus Bathyarchaeota archaeon]|nr:ArsR family transcriptional regulator [Candidatus Bathyarchaeota archaeon]
MSLPHRARGVKVLKAVSSPLRLQILNFLFDKGALSYTELMNALKMNPSRDAGRFAYHLKFLLKAGLVEADADAKKYFLTDLGKMVIDIAERVEKKAVKPKGMLVRTSHFTFEEFDPNKIANSLTKEAKMPVELAQKTAKETEKIVVKAKTKYLTAPLIREIVNVILIEKGLEEYRHKLTRLGLPVHEVSALVERKNPDKPEDVTCMAGKTVFREYTLLNVFPRDIADAHVSGTLHINDLSTWLLKPSEIVHDLRFFFQNGLKTEKLNTQQHSQTSPENFGAALAMAFNVLLFTQQEVNTTQTVECFNVFLAPYIRGLDEEHIKQELRLFIMNLNQHVDAALGLELPPSDALARKTAIGPKTTTGTYADFTKESNRLASLILEVLAKTSQIKPLTNPKVIVKINKKTLSDPEAQQILLKAHEIAADKGIVYFASLFGAQGTNVAFSASGVKLEATLSGDWETDTLRTGCLGCVTLNLPRIVREGEQDKTKFFSILKERCELAARALGIKQRALRHHGKNALPFLTQGTNGDTYFRLENCCGAVNLAGFNEAVVSFMGKDLNQEESVEFAKEVVKNTRTYLQRVGKRHGKRLFPAILHSSQASKRLAHLDIEKYGIAKTKFSGTRDKPFYATTRRLQMQQGNFPNVPLEQLDWENNLKGLNKGANLTIVDIDDTENTAEALMKFTAQLMQKHNVELLTYNRGVTYCSNCVKSWFGTSHKCPSCGSIGTVTTFDRYQGT